MRHRLAVWDRQRLFFVRDGDHDAFRPHQRLAEDLGEELLHEIFDDGGDGAFQTERQVEVKLHGGFLRQGYDQPAEGAQRGHERLQRDANLGVHLHVLDRDDDVTED